jgi:Flp pilus assembly protein TadB
MLDRLRKDVRNDPAGLAWFCAHGVALLILTLVTWARGVWYWVIASVLVVSCYGGQIVFRRRARRRRLSLTSNRRA